MISISDESLRRGLQEKIDDLEHKLAHFRAALEALGSNGSPLKHSQPVSVKPAVRPAQKPMPVAPRYVGLGAKQAVLAYFKRFGQRWATASEIYKELVEGGWRTTSHDPLGIVRATLKRLYVQEKTFDKRRFNGQIQYCPKYDPANHTQAPDTEELKGL